MSASGAASSPGRGRPLRRALVLMTVAAIALACALLGTLYITSMNTILLDRVDDRLRATVDKMSKPPPEHPDPGHPEPDGIEDQVGRLLMKPGKNGADLAIGRSPAGDAFAAVLRDGLVQPIDGPAVDALGASPPLAGPVTQEIDPERGRYRLLAGQDPSGNVMVVGVSLADTEATLRDAIVVGAWASVAVLVVAGAAILLLVRRALRPLEEIVETASSVSRADLVSDPGVLDQRVPPQASDEGNEAGRVGAALNRLLDHITRAFQQRDAIERRLRVFVADASHELRTPLASIRGYAELTRLSGERIPPDSAHALRRIEEESERMSGIVEDLLLLARLDQGIPLRRERIDLGPVVEDAVADAAVVAPGHDGDVRVVGAPLTVLGDEGSLRQAVGNVVSNAFRHTPAGTAVRVGAWREEDEVRVEVSDSGPGLPDEVRDHVFERFVRADGSRTRESGGTGLGLAITRSLVEAHGGSIAVRSAPGETTFTIRFPAAADEP